MFASALDEARVHIMRQDYGAAIPRLVDHLNGNLYDAETMYMLGGCFSGQGMNGLAVVLLTTAIQSRAAKGKPFPEALVELGLAYKAEYQNDMAEKFWLEALKHVDQPKHRANILNNLATLYVHEGRPEGALQYCDEAIALDPAGHKARANRGMACLEMGRWAEGWKGWKHAQLSGDRPKMAYGELPEWDGTPGQTVIVYGDQGIGDEIFFASPLADMQRVCKKVILDCHPRLPVLFKRSYPEIEVHGTRKDLTDLPWFEGCGADAAIALCDLFSFFRNSDESWGEGAPYLKAEKMLFMPEKGMRIGLSWTGGTKATRQHLRSISLDQFEPILRARPDAQWFSLQYTEDAARQVCEMEERTGIHIAHFPGWVDTYDYDRTASFVASLDLVITVPTTIHHVGGALGIPTWTLVQSRPSWRYMAKGARLPWYSSAKLFRQERDGDWRDPINRVAQELERL